MKIQNSMGMTAEKQRTDLSLGKAKCLHCYREMRMISSFHLVCRNCKAEEDDRGSFEWVLRAAGAL